MARAARARGAAQRIVIWARRPETRDALRGQPWVDAVVATPAEAVREASLVVIAAPVDRIVPLAREIAPALPPGAVVTDVGSVKGPLCAPATEAIGPKAHFVGSHPMAGSERGGLEAGSAGLFQNAACLLTQGRETPADRATALERFWQSVGCRTHWMEPGAHDELVARISHLPHLVAAAAALVSLEHPADGAFGGGGLRDTTRVASGNPGMWAEIVTENREALAGPLRATIAGLSTILSILERGDQDAARQWLADAKHLRDQLLPPR